MSVVEFASFVVSILALVECDFVHRPSNSEAVVGGQVELKCSTFDFAGDSIEWQHTAVGETRPEIINKKEVITGACGTRCSLRRSKRGEYNLIITELTLYDAGIYTCMDVLHSKTADAELVVFEAYPSPESCAAVLPSDGAVGQNSCGIDPDVVQLSCNMSYKGNLGPVMQWTSSEGVLRPTDRRRPAVGEFIVSGITVKTDEMRDSNFTCSIKYDKAVLISKYSWTTSIKVFSNQTKEVVVTNCKSAQVVDCTVSTGHSCSYSWTHIVRGDSKKTYSGPVLNLRKVPTGLYICRAVCSVRGTTCPVEPVKVDYCSGSQEGGISPGAIAAIVISIVLFVIIITIVALVLCIRRRHPGENNNDGMQAPHRDVELSSLITVRGETKDIPEGSGEKEAPSDLTGGKPDILGDIRVPDADKQTTMKPEDPKINGTQSELVTPPAVQGEADSGSEVDVSEFVFVNVNADSIEEKVEHRFPK